FHVRAGVAELFLGDLAERVAALDGVRPGGAGAGGSDRSPSRCVHLNVRDDVLLPVGDRLDRVPDLVLLRFRRDRSLEVQLTVVLIGVSLELSLAHLNRVSVLVSQTHNSPPSTKLLSAR